MPLAPGNQVYLERPQIYRLLERQVKNPVVVVNAGAGYGKTHSVYAFVRGYRAFTIWMQFSERDNVSERFWENFTAMIATADRKAAEKLEKIDFPETDRQFERYLEIPLDEIPPVGRCIFVYDDFHLVRNPAVLRFMERSITSPFPNITSILISRTEPVIDLGKLHSRGRLGRVTEEDLRFSREEMLEYFRIQQITPPSQTVSSIYRDTEGWAFAVHLAGLSLKHAPPGAPYVSQAMRLNIFKLLESEIMASVSGDLRKFLIKLSLIDYLAPDLLLRIASGGDAGGAAAAGGGITDTPTGADSGGALLDEMERLISFISFDVYQNAYQIHHLFLEYLSEKQAELSEDEKRGVYRLAAEWCAANNQKANAVTYYEKAGDYEQLLDVVATMPPVLPDRTARMLLEIMERAPPEIYDRIAHAHVQRTGLYLTLELFDKSREELLAVIADLEGRPPSPAAYRTLTGCYNLLGFLGMNTCPYTRDYDYVHCFEKARRYYDLNRFETRPPMSMMPLCSYLCRVNSEEAGEMEKYIEAISASIPCTAMTLGGLGTGVDDLCRGELAFFRGDIAGAEQFFLRGLQNARKTDQFETESRALFYLLRISLARGNYEALGDALRQMEAQLAEEYYPTRFTNHDILTGWYYAHIGRTDRLAPWLKNDFEESDLNSIVFGLEVLVKAKYHFSEKRYPAALAVLESWETRNSRWTFVLGKIEKKALEAVCRYHLKDKDAAFAALAEACRLSLPNAVVMPFAELGKHMRALAHAALREKAPSLPRDWLEKIRLQAAAYAKKLFAAAEQSRLPASPADPAQGMPRLSRREMGVLANLSQGMTQEEIAGISSISVNTVKSVVRSVYNKLGAVNKADAIRIAASRGLV
jgi:LuxR family maltose regulon positive regulatory protein